MHSFLATTIATLAVVEAVMAQYGGWAKSQVSATMCSWAQVRAHVIRDTLYLDGGDLTWAPGMATGEFGPPVRDINPYAYVHTLNFSTAFDTSQNISDILGKLSKTGENSASNNRAPNYYDGAMLGNDAEWFLYGGLVPKTDAYPPPDKHDVWTYQAFQYGSPKDLFKSGFADQSLPEEITRYVTYGGAASAPSENKAWYFSGMRSASWGPIYVVGANETLNAANVSNTLITLDMTTQLREKWSNDTLPDNIPGRANPELVWVPVGAQGILVAVGGVTYPDFATDDLTSPNPAASKSESIKFLSTVDIYDVASKKWYRQPTTGGPKDALARGCAVVSPAQDQSSFNIYWYGGYDGIDPTGAYNDDVWVLSLPSFVWQRIYAGKTDRGRAGHKCVLPYPDQMMVVGGYGSMSTLACVPDGIIRVFNLNTGDWQSTYDPLKWSKYEVPEAIFTKIGGSKTGGATMTQPSPSGWATSDLAKVFATPYPSEKIKQYQTYSPAPATHSNTTTNPPAAPQDHHSGLPKFLPPLLGVICGLMLVTAIAVVIILYKRRRLFKRGPRSEGDSDYSGNFRIMSWIRGQPTEKGAPTTTTSEGIPEVTHSPPPPPMSVGTPETKASFLSELPNSQVAELLGDTSISSRAELHSEPLSPVDIINRHSHFAPGASSINNASHFSGGVSQTDHASTVSRSSGQRAPVPTSDPRPDSPALGMAGRVHSGVSNVTENERLHLRQISDTTVSSVGLRGGGQSPTSPEPTMAATMGIVSPMISPPLVSPPSPRNEADDYLSARTVPETSSTIGAVVTPGTSSSSRRKSAFTEHDDVTPDYGK